MKYILKIQKLSGHDKSAKIGKINKRSGDTVKPGDTIFTIESGKGTVKYLSEYDGTLERLDISEGDTITLDQVIGEIEGTEKSRSEEKSTPAYTFGFAKPQQKNYKAEVVIVGGGPGGYVAAIRAAQNNKSVIIIEKDRLGGTCLNYGCIPTKALVSSADMLEKIKEAQNYGLDAQAPSFSLENIMKRKDEVVDTLVGGIEHLMVTHGIEYISGEAKVENATTLTVNTKKMNAVIEFEKLIIATGSSAAILDIPGADSEDILTSTELLELKEVPRSLTIIGGGVIGMEFAFIYNALGCRVNVVEYLPSILGNMDEDIAETVRVSAQEKGINLFEGFSALSITSSLDGSRIVEIKKEEKSDFIVSEKVAMATGRKANLDSLDLKKLEVELNERGNGIDVDEYCVTSNPDIYAIGDITNKVQLAHVASHMGIIAADHIVGVKNEMQLDMIPSAVFTMPEVAQAGITESCAKAQGLDYITGKFPFAANGKAQAMNETAGFVKLIADKNSRKIIGGCIAGVHATDMLSTISNIIASGLTIDEASHVIYSHPTASEGIHEAILSLDGRSIHFA